MDVRIPEGPDEGDKILERKTGPQFDAIAFSISILLSILVLNFGF